MARLRSLRRRARVSSRESRRGYGSALRAGFASARYEIIVMADADQTYPLDKIDDLVAPVARDEADLVLGCRLDAATWHTMPWLHRYVGTPTITFLTARACGQRLVSDSQSGFRAFRRDKLDAMGLQGTGMELASEMLIRSSRVGLRISEVHTGYRPRVGESKLDTWGDGWRHLQLILMLAPELLLIGPGASLAVLGLVMLLLAFVRPAGVEVGSLRWQPVFFSGIALVLGVQALLAGVVLAHNSSITTGRAGAALRVRGQTSLSEALRVRRRVDGRRRPVGERAALRGVAAGRRVAARPWLRPCVVGSEPHHRRRHARQLRFGHVLQSRAPGLAASRQRT